MKRFISSLFLCACCALSAFAQKTPQAPVAPTKDYPACFAAWDANLHTLDTHFTQTTQYDGVLISQSQGQILYNSTGPLLRLNTLENNIITQSALTDKKKIYILDEKGKEISTVDWSDWLSGQPNQALFDFGNYTALLKRHDVSLFDQTAQTAVLKLTPKNKSEGYILYVTLSAKNCFPQEITIESDLMKTIASLQDPKINTTLPTEAFKGIK